MERAQRVDPVLASNRHAPEIEFDQEGVKAFRRSFDGQAEELMMAIVRCIDGPYGHSDPPLVIPSGRAWSHRVDGLPDVVGGSICGSLITPSGRNQTHLTC
jgi:hypothetical protein